MTTKNAHSLYNRRLIGLLKQINEGMTIGSKQTVSILPTRHCHLLYIFTELDPRRCVHLGQLRTVIAMTINNASDYQATTVIVIMNITRDRCLHCMAPDYLSELYYPANPRPSRYQLRSSQSNQLTVPPVILSTYGPRSFVVAEPTI